ncbi:hypothetical protein MMC14_003390 [Varicellaria rhodocarpa]|nr:hypothetical protein [Varicellaria rhodocarpa]
MVQASTFSTFYKFLALVAVLMASIATPVYCTIKVIDERSVQGKERSFPYLNVHVADQAAEDVSRDMKDIHNQHKHTVPLAFDRNIKRAPSRSLRTCPIGQSFISSYCRDGTNTRAYTVMCKVLGLEPPQIRHHDSACASDEYCVDSTDWKKLGHLLEAFCIKQEDIVRWSADQNDKIQRYRALAGQIGLPSVGGLSNLLINVAIQDDDFMARLNAASMKVQAQKIVTIQGRVVYQTLQGGIVQCSDCSGVNLYPIPRGTQSVSVDMILANGIKNATLWIGSIELD